MKITYVLYIWGMKMPLLVSKRHTVKKTGEYRDNMTLLLYYPLSDGTIRLIFVHTPREIKLQRGKPGCEVLRMERKLTLFERLSDSLILVLQKIMDHITFTQAAADPLLTHQVDGKLPSEKVQPILVCRVRSLTSNKECIGVTPK